MKYKETNRALHRVRLGFAEGVQGLREARKRSLLGVNEHFEPEHNAEITRKAQTEGKVKYKETNRALHRVRLGFAEGVQGLVLF